MNFFLFPRFLGEKSHSNYCQLRDLHAWPWKWRSRYGLRDFFISACIYSTPMIFMLFREVCKSRNSFQLSPFAWPSRVTLKLKDTSRSTWLLLFLLVFVLPEMIVFLFRKVLVQGIHSNYCQLRDLHAWPWRSRHCLRDFLFCQVGKTRRPWRDLTFQGHTRWSRKWQ